MKDIPLIEIDCLDFSSKALTGNVWRTKNCVIFFASWSLSLVGITTG